MKCEQCGKEFEAKRETARFCSSTCRSKSLRATLTPATLKNATLNATDNVRDNHEAKDVKPCRHIKTIQECLDEGFPQRWLDNVEDIRFYTELTREERQHVILMMDMFKFSMSEAFKFI